MKEIKLITILFILGIIGCKESPKTESEYKQVAIGKGWPEQKIKTYLVSKGGFFYFPADYKDSTTNIENYREKIETAIDSLTFNPILKNSEL